MAKVDREIEAGIDDGNRREEKKKEQKKGLAEQKGRKDREQRIEERMVGRQNEKETTNRQARGLTKEKKNRIREGKTIIIKRCYGRLKEKKRERTKKRGVYGHF